MLDQALQTRIEGLLEAAPSPSFFTQLNPSRIIGVVRLFLGALGGSPKTADEPVSPLLTKCERYLQKRAFLNSLHTLPYTLFVHCQRCVAQLQQATLLCSMRTPVTIRREP